MKRTTIFVDEVLLAEVKDIARQEKKSAAEILREAMESYVSRIKGNKKLSIIGIGESRQDDIAETHEEILWRKRS